MVVETIQLPNRNEFAAKYVRGELNRYFAYDPFEDQAKRIKDLQKRTFNREALVSVLTDMNASWDAPEETFAQIERLTDENSVVVVGGQQAGLLTGPLYTIHKIISIIKYAKEQEAKWNIPVIPVFWIAGEDHDYDEINHLYTTANETLNKRIISQEEWQRRPISKIPLDHVATKEWVKEVFRDLPETTYTRDLATSIFKHIEASQTFVDFFARVTFDLFEKEGLVLIDSGDEALRQLESSTFEQLIQQQPAITEAIYTTGESLRHEGFPIQVDITKEDGHLFYHDEQDERILLMRDGERWVGKNEEVSLTTEDLLSIARETPHRLSNNVMTRPIMQEMLFPTLAFMAGDGEISYWALLKKAFEAFDSAVKMPPVVPRLSITLVTERVRKLLQSRVLEAPYIINNGCQRLKTNWLSAQQNPPVNLLFTQLEEEVKDLHQPIQTLASSIGPDLGAEATRNLTNILREVDYMKKRTIHHLQGQYEEELTMFDELQLSLRPNDGLQERVLNIVPLLNECGPSFIDAMIELDLSFMKDHHIIDVYKL